MNKGPNPSDRYLIQQYLAGRTSVLPVLVERYHKLFCEKAYWVTKDKEMAKDTAQESWITIINKLHTLQNADSFKSWAYRIVYSKAIDTIKHRNKVNSVVRSVPLGEPSRGTAQDEVLAKQEALLGAIKCLPKEKQDIIRLFYAEEYSLIEISAFLNIPIGTVKSRLFKAREKLKSILKKCKS